MASSAVLPETLKSITATKIEELSKQCNSFESSKAKVLQSAEKQTGSIARVEAILEGSCRIEGLPSPSDLADDDIEPDTTTVGEKLKNYRRFVRQAQVDPSFSDSVTHQIGEELTQELNLKSTKYEHAKFFSELVTEWLSKPDGAKAQQQIGTDPEAMSSSDVDDNKSSFEEVGRKEMHEQRAQWEDYVFSEKAVDAPALKAYLESLFCSSKTKKQCTEDLRRDIRNYGIAFKAGNLLDVQALETTLKALLRADLLSGEKIAILKTFSGNKEVLGEVADVLNMRFASLCNWSWTTASGGIPLEMRKQLNGKYRVFMDEDVLDALFLYAIGIRWATKFREVFTNFFDSLAWSRSARTMSELDRERRDYYLGSVGVSSRALHSKRRQMYAGDYFMNQLPLSVGEGGRSYDESNTQDDGLEASRKGPLGTKHSLLHLLIAESLISTRLYGDFTAIRSDFKWFGPSLPHNAIFTVLQFFGVGDTWLDFFRRFLHAPLRFVQDGKDAQVHVRTCGVPMSHVLSDVFGEVMMFCMDYAVNQRTDGSFLYRLHDDFWFWGQQTTCQQAWGAMSDFASVMGLEFNEEKTGTARLGAGDNSSATQRVRKSDSISDEPTTNPDTGIPDPTMAAAVLPNGEIRWGFLHLDAASGRLLIDQSKVDEHTKELRLQLSHCNSVFSYVQAYNAYFDRFFSNNFGKPCFAFGTPHIDMMIETFSRIHDDLYPTSSVTDYLRGLIEERFGMKELPDGFFYWPIQMGGLELQNPFIPLLGMRESFRRSPARMLEKALDKDEADYVAAKEHFEDKNKGNGIGERNSKLSAEIRSSGEHFMPLDEFMKYREETSKHLALVYDELLAVPVEKAVKQTIEISGWFAELKVTEPAIGSGGRGKNSVGGINSRFRTMKPYWQYVLAVHGGGIVKRYGGIRIVSRRDVPIGVVGVMKAGRLRWKG